MLELENLVEVRKGSGVYVINFPKLNNDEIETLPDVGPFELLQARQLLESSIAEFAAIQAARADVLQLKEILERERNTLEHGNVDYFADEDFHKAIAEITQNEVIIQMQKIYGHIERIIQCGMAYMHIFQIKVIVIYG